MNPILTALIIYITGVVVSAFIIRFLNAKEKYRFECYPPLSCLLSWICLFAFIIAYTIGFLAENTEEFFNYKDKK
jgi:D-alanyl-lipoteichoic acid acyltransferase DltB (MBOAT superfamily)